MPRGITSAATSAPTGGVGATDFTTQATKKAPRRKASYIGKKATRARQARDAVLMTLMTAPRATAIGRDHGSR